MKKALRSILPAFVILTMLLAALPAHSVQAVSANVVISQVYGGGGNTGGVYTNDFVELFNRGSETVSLEGWSIQYASATGTGNFGSSATQLTPLSGSIAPGQYILIQEAAGSNVFAALPTPDITDATAIGMSGTGGKVALVSSATGLGCNGGSNPCTPAQLALIVDLVGWDGANFYETAPAPATTNSTAVLRNGEGCTDTDNNSADFTAGTPAPRNSASPLYVCGSEPTSTDPSAVGAATPSTLFTGDSVLLTLAVTGGTNPDSTSLAVSCDLSSIGGVANQAFFDDGTNGDATAADNTFSFATSVASSTTSGAKSLACTITDAEVRTGNASIALTVTQIIPIGEVNGAVSDTEDATTHRSLFAPASGTSAGTAVVTVQGVVFEKTMQAGSNTAYGIFIQNTAATADGDVNTSDGLFVYMGYYDDISGPTGYYVPQVGDELIISGKISEYYNMTEMSKSLKILKIVRTGVDIDAEVAPVVANPPVDLADANRYWERMQGMRVQVPEGSVVLGGRNVFSPADAEIWVAAPDSTVGERSGYEQRAFRDAHPLDDNYDPTYWDGNGYRILMGSLGIKAAADNAEELIDPARTFDTVTNAPAGGLNYTYSKYRIEISEQPTFAEGIDPAQNNPVQAVEDRTTAYSIVDYNLENLYDYRNNPFSGCDFAGDTGCPMVAPFLDAVKPPYNYVPASEEAYQARVADIASQVINDLHSPDVLMLQEVENQDFCSVDGGSLTCGETNADGKPDVLQDLALEIAAQGGPAYDAAFDPDSSDLRGILPAYLYRTDRVELVDPTGDPILGTTPAIVYDGAGVPANSDISNPKTLNAELPAGITACETSWVFPRAASVALFRIFVGEIGDPFYNDVYVINNHFKSGPDTCVAHRTEQAKYNAAIISFIESVEPNAKVVMGGDLNVYPEPDNTSLGAPEQLGALYDPAIGMKNLWEVLLGNAPEAAYSYVYMGMAQTLDQMFVNQPLLGTLQDFKIAHINSDFPADYPEDVARGTSDHDPNAATFAMSLEYGGFVSAGGWFKSPVDGYKVKFDIAAKYKNNSDAMTGDTVLELGKDMTFESSGYTWLSQVGNIAMLKGSGTINGAGDYSFLITLKDDSPDQIKIMIWDASGIVYDTGSLVDIGNGSIMFH